MNIILQDIGSYFRKFIYDSRGNDYVRVTD